MFGEFRIDNAYSKDLSTNSFRVLYVSLVRSHAGYSSFLTETTNVYDVVPTEKDSQQHAYYL